MAEPNDDPRNRAPEQDAPPVIVGCAEVDRATAEEAAGALRARGHAVDVIAGLEDDERLLADAIARHERQGLYVLCRSASLPRQRIDLLRSVLRGNDVPFGRTLTLAIEAGQARALEERIVSVARRMITGRVESVRGPARPLPRSVSVAVHSGFGEEVDTRVDRKKAASPPAPSERQVEVRADSFSETLPVAAPGEVDDGDSMEITQRNPLADDEPDGMQYAIDPPAYSGVDVTQVAPAPRQPVATVRAPVIPLEPGSAPGISELVDDPEDSAVAAAAASLGGVLGRKSTRVVGWSLGLVALLIVGVVSVTKLSATTPEPEQARPDEAIASAERSDVSDPASGEPPAGGVPESPRPEVADEVEDADDEDDEDDVGLREAEALAIDERQPPAEPALDNAGAVPLLEDSPQVLAALRSRDVRAIDTLLVATKTSKDVEYEDAISYCAALKLAELEGWRVPAIGELWTLGAAKMMKSGVYWSDTIGDAHGEKRLVLNSKRSRIVPVDATWKGARAVCVRERS
jgi:hypothetical protein